MKSLFTRVKRAARLPKKICNVEGCGMPNLGKGLCRVHYDLMRRRGSTTRLNRKPRKRGTGSITGDGYVLLTVDGIRNLEHVLIAEKALDRPLRWPEQVHHVDCNKQNNDPTNLVVCPDHAYHDLIEKRTRAYNACCHVDWLKCWICKRYDAPENIVQRKGQFHRECWNKLCKEANHLRKVKTD